MNRKEAILRIKDHMEHHGIGKYPHLKLKEALDMAIAALSPPNEPLTLDSRLTPKMVTCPKGWQGVRDTRFYCPGCKKAVKKGEAYCHKCGQALIFPVQRYDKENNRIWLDFSDRRPPERQEDTCWTRDAAIEDLEEIMFKGGHNIDTCHFCANGQCYRRGGTQVCNPLWRGIMDAVKGKSWKCVNYLPAPPEKEE